MPDPATSTIALCVLTHDRPVEVEAALRSAGDAFDEVVVLDNASDPPLEPVAGTTWHRSDVNLGVTGGRDELARRATADVLLFLDDDAILAAPIADHLRAEFASEPRLGLIAARITRADGSTVSSEHPFRGPARDVGTARPCAYFVGAGYAVRAEALAEVGGYDERYFYSTEEIDLGLRLLAAGWELRYDPALHVEHRPATTGRGIAPRVPAMRMRNRIMLARQHLPVPVAVVHVSLWTARTAVEAARARGLREWARGVRDGWREPVERRVLRRPLLVTAHRHGGRVLW